MSAERCKGCGRYRDEGDPTKPCENSDGYAGCQFIDVDENGMAIPTPAGEKRLAEIEERVTEMEDVRVGRERLFCNHVGTVVTGPGGSYCTRCNMQFLNFYPCN